MSTRKLTTDVFRVGIVAATMLAGTIAFAQNVPYGAPLPPPPAGQGGGAPGGGPGRGFGGMRGMFTMGQIQSVNGSSFVVTDNNNNNVTVKTTATTTFIKSTDGTADDIKVGDTLQVNGRPDTSNNIAARRITDGTVSMFPNMPRPGGGGGAPPAGAPPGGGAGGQGGQGGNGMFRRMAPISGVVTVLSPLTIKATDGTVYTIDTSNVNTVTMTSAGTIDDVVADKYAIIIATPPATPPAPSADGTPPAPPTNMTAVRVVISDTQPQFGRGFGGGGRPGGGGFGGGGGGGAAN